jgi:sigma-B regulation protein RsbU (phosphoserine phosphatase)
MGQVKNFEARIFRALRRDPPESKVHRLAFWVLIIYLALMPGRLLPGMAGQVFGGLSLFTFLLLLAFCIPLVWRWIFGRFLWKLRNRLIMTYLLMALTPIVLFVLLALIALYGFSGQFAIFAASSEMDMQLEHFSAENRAFAMHVAHLLTMEPGAKSVALPEMEDTVPARQEIGVQVAAFHDGKPVSISPANLQASDITQVPSWAKDHFSNVVLDHRKLYLRAIDMQTIDGHTTTLITSVPVDKQNIDQVAHGIGRIEIAPNLPTNDETSASSDQSKAGLNKSPESKVRAKIDNRKLTRQEVRENSITGGMLPPAEHFYDIPITFYAPLKTTDWETGKPHNAPMIVTSRPSLLYQRLFIASLEIAAFVQNVLIGVAAFFGLLELIAFIMAVRLNRTITRSVSDLYDATVEIDQGNLTHRIKVTRNDQLAALSRSFNRMSYSLERLLSEQREKERLQGELAIAQEVQANLFPRSSASLPMLELHGACYPARTVSGDYYDFLVFGDSGLGLALGDISGKGISAALLMATLHSAVRAYRYAGEDLVVSGSQFAAPMAAENGNGSSNGHSDPFLEPGKILAQLNRHLYRSTQPEKYATLFLAHYDGLTSQLTYSCGGQLPPLVLRSDNSVIQLGCGGTVVGLLENASYEQGVEQLNAGDILIAYSDGVTEPENDFGEFGEERLIDVVRRHRHMPLDAISEQVMQALRNWIGGQEQPDDITLVLARQR